MKNRLLTWLNTAAIAIATSLPALAADATSGPVSATQSADPGTIIVDVLVVRPVCLAATAVGAACWVVALPIAAISKSVKPAADALVVKPAKATFTRPLGDMEALLN